MRNMNQPPPYTSSELLTINAARLLRDGAVGFVGGAQIAPFGNINATVIGAYDQPKVRLPGSGGSMEIAAWANRCYILTPHQKRRFPERLDFRTSAGFLGGRAEREAAHLRGGGTQAVVTDLGILEPDATGELTL